MSYIIKWKYVLARVFEVYKLHCIHPIASGGYYGLRMSTPPPQCVEISRYPSRGQGIIGRLLKFAGYIYNHKILPGNIFGLILKNKMAATGVFQISTRSFVGPLEQRVL